MASTQSFLMTFGHGSPPKSSEQLPIGNGDDTRRRRSNDSMNSNLWPRPSYDDHDGTRTNDSKDEMRQNWNKSNAMRRTSSNGTGGVETGGGPDSIAVTQLEEESSDGG
ncbi:hypothetical protein PIB30_016243 [Stylosanthes scabra]|uniref:Uncharacterized protein n=1 Tax=Stylosanthes scabra TaxID=79078 RepID=A0ABU6X791_9FABA|nr:hypothetical protein [Stylosanthes scabra]